MKISIFLLFILLFMSLLTPTPAMAYLEITVICSDGSTSKAIFEEMPDTPENRERMKNSVSCSIGTAPAPTLDCSRFGGGELESTECDFQRYKKEEEERNKNAALSVPPTLAPTATPSAAPIVKKKVNPTPTPTAAPTSEPPPATETLGFFNPETQTENSNISIAIAAVFSNLSNLFQKLVVFLKKQYD